MQLIDTALYYADQNGLAGVLLGRSSISLAALWQDLM
jgi:hypothetical protein